MHSYFKLPNSARITGNKRGYFSVRKDTDLNTYKLKVIPYIANQNDFCEYSIVSFTNPKKYQQRMEPLKSFPMNAILKK